MTEYVCYCAEINEIIVCQEGTFFKFTDKYGDFVKVTKLNGKEVLPMLDFYIIGVL